MGSQAGGDGIYGSAVAASEEVDYKDLGGDYFYKRNQEKTTRRLIKQLEQFGYQVELKRVA